MSTDTQRQLAEYKAEVDAKYAAAKGLSFEAAMNKQRQDINDHIVTRRDHWLLISPKGEIDGVLIRRESRSAIEAFEQFFPKKRERLKAAEDGWHIEQDDIDGTRFDAWRAEFKEAL